MAGRVLDWLRGKKTYLVAGLTMAAVLLLVFLGKLTPATGISVALFAISLFGVTFRAAMEQHHEEILVVLEDVAQAGLAFAGHNTAKLLAAAEQAAIDGGKLAVDCRPSLVARTNAPDSGAAAL
jgi:hypothetical protein